MRRLPAWTPLVLGAVAILSIPVLFALPRRHAPDALLEAAPFLLAGAALLSIPLSAPGRLRTLGVVVALLVATAPVWWFLLLGAAEEARARDTTTTFHVLVVPEDEDATYDLLVPLPLDASGRPPPALASIPTWERRVALVEHQGVPMLRVTGQGTLDRGFFHAYGSRTEDWMDHRWPGQGAAFGPSEASAALTVVLTYEGASRFCSGGTVLAGAHVPGGASFLRESGGIACA